jgi:hypothetical protein
MDLAIVRNMRFGPNERFAWDNHNSFIWTATCVGRQFPNCLRGDIFSDNGKVTGLKFENIRTASQSSRLHSVLVRVRAQSAQKHVAVSFSTGALSTLWMDLLDGFDGSMPQLYGRAKGKLKDCRQSTTTGQIVSAFSLLTSSLINSTTRCFAK